MLGKALSRAASVVAPGLVCVLVYSLAALYRVEHGPLPPAAVFPLFGVLAVVGLRR